MAQTGLDVIRRGISDARARLAAALPEIDTASPSRYLYAPPDAPTGVFANIGRDVRTVFELFDLANDAAVATASAIARCFADPRLTLVAQRADATGVIVAARANCAALLDEARGIADAAIASLRAMTEPPRPASADDEAALGNLRADLRMQLDRSDGDNVAAHLVEILRDYVAEGDSLAVWFLTATPWVGRYLGARGVDVDFWRASIGPVISPFDDEGTTRAREVLGELAGGSGLAGALDAMRIAVDAALEDVATGFGLAA